MYFGRHEQTNTNNMKVLIVCNNAYMRGNGICTAILSLLKHLKERGIEARLLACENPDKEGEQPDFPLKHFKIPIFEKLISSNGFRFATVDKKVITEAVKWADVVHIAEPFPLEIVTIQIAQKFNTPCIGTFHFFSENILANLGIKNARHINRIITWFWKKAVYDHCSQIQCPTVTVRDYLLENGYNSPLVVISNGIEISEEVFIPAPLHMDPVEILCIGRLANEKSQKTLLEAMKYSRHADEIQLHFAGKGPKEGKYRKFADKLVKDGILKHRPIFGFYTAPQLKSMTQESYLFIHCAWVEVEGLSCVEAIKEGIVPIIAKGPVTAAWQFALDSRSIFPESDAKALAERIDWWIEHPQQRQEMGSRYAESVKNYNIEDSIDKIIKMYEESMRV